MMPFRLMDRKPRSMADLRADSGTVRYELDMLLDTAQRYGEADARGDRVEINMAVESFALHCRALILFLFGHVEGVEAEGQTPQRFATARDTDVFAWDYDSGWREGCPEPSEEMYHSKRRADKHIAHITTDRRGVNQPGTGIESVWQLRVTVEEIGRGLVLFLRSAKAVNFDPEELRKMKARLAPWSTGTAPSAPLVGRSGPLDPPSATVDLSAKTEPRAVPPPPGFYSHGKTE